MGAKYEKPEGYMPRVADAQIERYLKTFGAVEIAGTKWCGKTWSALMQGASVSYVDENLDLARADPSMMLIGDRPHVIDEWQRVPAIWDCVRHEVDRARGTRGAFILTGSSTPATRQGEQGPAHSGAGRIGRVRMSPMSLFESGESTGQVSLEGLFAGEFTPCVAERDTVGLVEAACRGGWPEAVDMEVDAAQLIAREYVTAALGVSIPALGLDPDIARRLASSLARNLGQAATYKTIINDMFGAEANPLSVIDEGRVRAYLDALKGMYIVEEVPGWAPPARDRKRFATKPKRYLADPSLACALLGMSPAALLADWQTFGLVFENMAVRDLSVYARALDLLDDVPVRYYRDDSGVEADAIVQLADGRWAAFEFKVSEDKVEKGVASLERMRRKVCENPRSQTRPPEFMAVITGVGEYAREVAEGIVAVPIRLLGK
ncbi:ATP-binding protein [Ellagibacter isourolithinifaciens]|uniref:ATP-binding protein n=1 Tax=Ellagibacter isourolithinifaciens TaxID=2137581 RepID=UPI003A908530